MKDDDLSLNGIMRKSLDIGKLDQLHCFRDHLHAILAAGLKFRSKGPRPIIGFLKIRQVIHMNVSCRRSLPLAIVDNTASRI